MMISQILNLLNPNSASATVDSSNEEPTGESMAVGTIDTSFDNLQFPFAGVPQQGFNFRTLKASVADLVSPPPFHDPAGAVDFAFGGWGGESPATLICASAE